MTTYNTGNPIGSKDPRDLYDNAENLDEAVNTRQAESWDDRFGVARKTWWGMEREFDTDQASRVNRFNTFIASSGYQFLGDYAADIEITEYNQIVRDANGEFWRVSGQVGLPYTTTGAGLPEDDSLTPLGDAVLRQELDNPAMGALMVRGAVVYVNTIADLQALDTSRLVDGQQAQVKEYHAGTGVGGGAFYWDVSSTEEENSVTIFGGHTQGRWKRNQELFNVFYVDWAGAVPNDPAKAVENYHAIRKCQEVAINEIGRLGVAVESNNGKCKIVLGAGIYYVQGNSVFAFSNEELQSFGYYNTSWRRRGVNWEG